MTSLEGVSIGALFSCTEEILNTSNGGNALKEIKG
jgi:hypothetical protein